MILQCEGRQSVQLKQYFSKDSEYVHDFLVEREIFPTTYLHSSSLSRR